MGIAHWGSVLSTRLIDLLSNRFIQPLAFSAKPYTVWGYMRCEDKWIAARAWGQISEGGNEQNRQSSN